MHLLQSSKTVDLLVIGTSVDSHIDAVLQYIPSNVEWFRLNVDHFPRRCELSISLANGEERPIITAHSEAGQFDLSHVRAVWFRRLGAPQLSPHIVNPAYRSFALGESEALISGLSYLLANAKWVSSYDAVIRARSKIYQLDVAQKCGLLIPTTLATNMPLAAERFVKMLPRTLYKTVHSPSIMEGEKHSLVFSHLMKETDLDMIDQIQLAPCQFQEYVDKRHELRITFTGDDLFPAVIDSQSSQYGTIDWRAALRGELQYAHTTLPDEVKQRLLQLLKELGLLYGAIDMIVTPTGEYVYLEVNPHGAWLWLEEALQLPIAASLAHTLTCAANS
jgi:hypothetical protein